MKDDEKLVKRLRKQSRALLKEAMASVQLDKKVVAVVDEDDGETYYAVEKNSGLSRADILVVDGALIACAMLYSDSGMVNTSSYYRKVSRMVHYALYELESREMLEHEILFNRSSVNAE